MSTVLVAYATSEGQTGRVADRIAQAIEEAGHEATARNLKEADASDIDLAEYDAVLVGASIHAGKHQPIVHEFAADHRDELEAVPPGFFQMSLSSATEQGREQAAGYVEAFVAENGWEPDRIGLFGGALRYSEMGFLKRTFTGESRSEPFPAPTPARTPSSPTGRRSGPSPPTSQPSWSGVGRKPGRTHRSERPRSSDRTPTISSAMVHNVAL